MLADGRYALRRWRRRPGFAATAVLTLALGIAAATATFSVVDAVLLRPLPWTAPASLVVIHGVYPERRNNPATAATWDRGQFSYPAWDALRTSPAFEAVGVWRSISRMDTTFGEDRSDLVRTMDVSANFLPMLGVRMALGRYFTEQEDSVTTDSIILTHEAWQRRFGARADVIGERVTLGSASSMDRSRRTVVGVLAPGFRFEGEPPEILRPVGIGAAANRQYSSGSFRAVARLSAGVSREAAEASAASLVSATRTTEPLSARLVELEEEHLGTSRRPLWMLFGGAGLLLLIACANVAALLLGEARARQHEIAVRAALGGSRARVIRQLIVEHILLAAAGVAGGLVLARWLIGAIVSIAPESLPRMELITLDLRAVTFALAAGLLTLLMFGVGPAMSLARTQVARALAQGGRDGAASRLLGQRAVVIAEIALALVLLTGAGLFAETMVRLTSQPLGFDPDNLAVVSTTFTGRLYGNVDPARLREARVSGADFGAFMDRLRSEANNVLVEGVTQRVAALPRVTSVAGASAVPFVLNPIRIPVVLEGRPENERHDVMRQVVTGNYFEAMRIRLLDGRLFAPGDRSGDRVAVVSREFQRSFFPSGALGREFRHVYGERFELSVNYRIIGVVEEVKRQEFSDDDRPAFYGYSLQSGAANHFLVRTSADPAAVLPAVRAAIKEVDPQLVVTSMSVMADRVARSVAEERFRATLSTLFGAAALMLAAVGLYGLMTRRSVDRRREFSVRVALGARPSDVGRLVLKDAAILITLGLAAGLPAAFAVAQVTRAMLFGVSPSSPHVFAFTAAMLAAVAVTATLLPARRASRADPIAALKS